MPAASRFNNNLRYRDANDPSQVAITPAYLLDPLRKLLGWIDLDPCTTPSNPVRALNFYTPPQDGLSEPWGGGNIFVNPPYGKAREPWVHRSILEAASGSKIALLIPAATDTAIFQLACSKATSVLFVKGRLKFGVLRPNRRQVAASHPSALLGFNIDLTPLSYLGVVVSTVKQQQ